MLSLGLIGLLLGDAHAVPVQLSQHGRLLDSSGAAVNGQHLLTFRLYDDQFAGSMVWGETLTLSLNGGYYVATLGSNTATNPLEDSMLANGPLFIEVEVDNAGPIGSRQLVVSSPFSRRAGVAENVEGGSVSASELSVGGSLVIDSTGSWVGPAIQMNWSDIQNMPTDLADGDDDTLASISCSAGEILGWDGSQWGCAADNGLTESEVEAFVTNGPLDLNAATTVGGLPILTQGDGDTLSGLSCQSGELAKYDTVLTQWVCDVDIDTDTQLSESDVEAYVVNDAIDLASGSMVDGNTILTDADVLAVDWANVVNVPSDIADGDADTDSVLSESQVEDFVTDSLDLASGTTVTSTTSSQCNAGEFQL